MVILLKTTGIVRKIDELGRIVLPKELRKSLNINAGDDFQITMDNNKIVLEKYSRLINIESEIKKIIEIFNKIYSFNILVVRNNKLINSEEKIEEKLIKIIYERKIYIKNNVEKVKITNNIEYIGKLVINPIVLDSDLLGSIIVVGEEDIGLLVSSSKLLSEFIKKNFI